MVVGAQVDVSGLSDVPSRPEEVFASEAKSVQFATTAKSANAKRNQAMKNSNFDSILSKKDAKIQQLIKANNQMRMELKKSVGTTSALQADREEAQVLIEELRDVIDSFQCQLDEAKVAHSEMHVIMHAERELRETLPLVGGLEAELAVARQEVEKYRKEAGILTRALAVNAVEAGADGEATLTRGQELWELDELRADVKRLSSVDTDLRNAQIANQHIQSKLEDMEDVHSRLTAERIENDRLRHELVAIQGRQVGLTEESGFLRGQISELETVIADRNAELSQMDEAMRTIERNNSLFQKDISSLEMSERRLQQRTTELEQLVAERDLRLHQSSSELASLRSLVTGLDCEIRSLASSLAAEADSNENLTARLSRVEDALSRSDSELATLRRRHKESGNSVRALLETRAENEDLKRQTFGLQSALREKESSLEELRNSRDVMKRTLSLEIQRLNGELAYLASTSASLTDKNILITKEKDKIKSLLATDTMTKLGRILKREESVLKDRNW